jgi:hypothetical protein
MSKKRFAEFYDSFGWNGLTVLRENRVQENHAARSIDLSSKSLRDLAMCLRLVPARTFLLCGTFLFILAACFVAGFLTQSHCGTEWGYYGCEIFTNTEDLAGW